VVLETADEERAIRIVGADEIDPAKRHISIDSPLARSLLKKTVDDEVSVEVEGQTHTYVVLEVAYEE
jgi:transcription elongation factor GreB